SGGRVWSSLKTNLSKHTCCFSDFRWPVDTPDFPSSARLRQYIEDYAAHFDLAKHIRFGVSVTAAVPCLAADGSPRWNITFTSTTHHRCAARGEQRTTNPSVTAQEDVVQRTETFDKCIIASGIFAQPHFPPVEGIAEAVEQGWATHGAAYRDPGLFAGKSVLVVGCAFSGAEIASDLAGVACRCLAATGRPSIFLPRFVAIHAARGPPSFAGVPQDGAGNVAAKPGNGTSTAGDGALRSAHAVRWRSGDDSSSDKRGSEKHPENPRCPQDTPPPLATASPRVPLDLALYSRRARAGSKLAPASEKLESSRKFLVELAGRDPGDAHEALRLLQRSENSHGSESGSVRVVVSDDFLDRVRDGCIEIRQRLVALDTTERTVRFSDGGPRDFMHGTSPESRIPAGRRAASARTPQGRPTPAPDPPPSGLEPFRARPRFRRRVPRPLLWGHGAPGAVDSSHVEWCGSNADGGGDCGSLAGEPVSKNSDTSASISDGLRGHDGRSCQGGRLVAKQSQRLVIVAVVCSFPCRLPRRGCRFGGLRGHDAVTDPAVGCHRHDGTGGGVGGRGSDRRDRRA
ncbi:unnamed protein product, partial [Ectocarpus sp. 4 AP-2014]